VGVALRADPHADAEDTWDEADRVNGERGHARAWREHVWPLERSQVLAGLLLGIAATARLPLVFAAPWFILVGGGSSRLRRLVSAGVGGLVPVGALLLYTYLTTGSPVHPGYDYQYQLEANGYPTLGYHPSGPSRTCATSPEPGDHARRAARDRARREARHARLRRGGPAVLGAGRPALAVRPDCPLAMPIDIGTSILLSAPGLLLALFAVARHPLARLTLGTGATVLIIALFNLAHFSQGWVQWGYRFSLDFIPFLLPLVALALRADGRPRLPAIVLVAAGAAINLWGVAWGQLLGW
jgi:hypothetical protein